MGGATAFGFYDNDAKLVSYYFMGDSAMEEIETYLHKPYEVMKDCARSMFEGNCLLDDFKSSEFAQEHDLVGAIMILPDSMVCYKEKTIIIYRRRGD